jgi:hypothetical protein
MLIRFSRLCTVALWHQKLKTFQRKICANKVKTGTTPPFDHFSRAAVTGWVKG